MVHRELPKLLKQLEGMNFAELSYPHVYSDLVMMKLFVYFRVMGITTFLAMGQHLEKRPDVLKLVGLRFCPHRTTLSKRFKSIPAVVQNLLKQMTQNLIDSKQIDPTVGAVDASLMKADGNVWHKKQMEAGELPKCGNVDVEARWGKSGCKGWVYGYGLHTLLIAGPIPWPCAFAVHPAHRKEPPVLRDELLAHLPKDTRLLLGDGGYDDEESAQDCEIKSCTLLTSMAKTLGKQVSELRRERYELYHSLAGREAFVLRKTTIEPFQGHLKNLFELERLPIKGLKNVAALCAISILCYCLLVCLNIRLNRPPTQIKTYLYSLR